MQTQFSAIEGMMMMNNSGCWQALPLQICNVYMAYTLTAVIESSCWYTRENVLVSTESSVGRSVVAGIYVIAPTLLTNPPPSPPPPPFDRGILDEFVKYQQHDKVEYSTEI